MVRFNITDIPIDANYTQLTLEYSRKVGIETAKTLLKNDNKLKVDQNDVLVTGSYIFDKDPKLMDGEVNVNINASK